MMFFEKHMDGLRYLGTEPDEYGYDGFKWVYEPVPPTDANVIIGRFIESQTEPLVEAKATKAT